MVEFTSSLESRVNDLGVGVTKLVCKDCEVKIGNIIMKVDLILFELNELDVILRMDFLTK